MPNPPIADPNSPVANDQLASAVAVIPGLGFLSKFLAVLSGARTYILLALGVVAYVAGLLGWIDMELANRIAEACGVGTILMIRAAIANVAKSVARVDVKL